MKLLRFIGYAVAVSFFVAHYFLLPKGSLAYDVTDKFSVEGSLVGVYQYAHLKADDQALGQQGLDKGLGRGSGAAELGINLHLTDTDEFQLSLGFGAGDGLKSKPIFSLMTNADDLEHDLKNINGRERDYLMEAWYRHKFRLGDNASLSGTFGIIDSTSYLDENEYANCEESQFMNEVFVNNPVLNLPSYDLGGVMELTLGDVSARLLGMGSRTEDWENQGSFRGYTYWALQLGYNVKDPLGGGNIRLMGYTTTKDFKNMYGTGPESLKGFGLSMDHGLGEVLGLFLRAGWQDDSAEVVHKKVYSGGIEIKGKAWGRDEDAVGLGYAYLEGSKDLDSTHAIEGYFRLKATEYSHFTVDVQYLTDNFRDNPRLTGTVYGARFVVKF